MAARDIIDFEGNVIGTMELPDDTPEQEWQHRLAPFAVNPSSLIPPEDPIEKLATLSLDQLNALLKAAGFQ